MYTEFFSLKALESSLHLKIAFEIQEKRILELQDKMGDVIIYIFCIQWPHIMSDVDWRLAV